MTCEESAICSSKGARNGWGIPPSLRSSNQLSPSSSLGIAVSSEVGTWKLAENVLYVQTHITTINYVSLIYIDIILFFFDVILFASS